MSSTDRSPRIVRWTRRLEEATALDAPVAGTGAEDHGRLRHR